jgi:hypothetical protein
MKVAVFWVVAPCSLVEVYRRFRRACCLHHHTRRPDDGGNIPEDIFKFLNAVITVFLSISTYICGDFYKKKQWRIYLTFNCFRIWSYKSSYISSVTLDSRRQQVTKKGGASFYPVFPSILIYNAVSGGSKSNTKCLQPDTYIIVWRLCENITFIIWNEGKIIIESFI